MLNFFLFFYLFSKRRNFVNHQLTVQSVNDVDEFMTCLIIQVASPIRRNADVVLVKVAIRQVFLFSAKINIGRKRVFSSFFFVDFY